MKRNLNLPMVDLEGKPYEDASTLRDVVYMALRATLPGIDDKSTQPQKNEVFALAMRAVQGGVIEVSAKELQMLIDRIAVAFPSPIVFGIASRMLEQDYVEPDTTKA